MQHVHLAPDNDEDDLYSFDDHNAKPDLDLEALEQDEGFQKAVKTSYGNRPPIPGTGMVNRAMATPLKTGVPVATRQGTARPITAIQGAGFVSSDSQSALIQFNEKTSGLSKDKHEETPEEAIKHSEKRINNILEESVLALGRGENKLALDKAKESAKMERILCAQRDQTSLSDQTNLDLRYYVQFNLANQYQASQMYSEALNTYFMIVKNKLFNNGGRLRVNMGNIYFTQKNHAQAVKMYQMALDQISEKNHKNIRKKIHNSIGSSLIKMGKYQDAIISFEQAMEEEPSHTSAYNLVLCYFAVGDSERMKKAFERLIKIPLTQSQDEKFLITSSNENDTKMKLLEDAIKDDPLSKWLSEEKERVERFILSSAKVIAPVITTSFAAGFDWCIEKVKISTYTHLACELEISKAIAYLKNKDFSKAIETLKVFEKKDSKMASTALSNLAFLYFLEGDLSTTEKYAEKAIHEDKYNPSALVNKGCCLYSRGDFRAAESFFGEALTMDATLFEALFDLALTYKQVNRFPEALNIFLKLQLILPTSVQVFYQLADLYDRMDDLQNARDWFDQLISLCPIDPYVLTRLADLCERDGDSSQAFQYRFEAFKYYPSDIDNITWLGAYYMESQFVEKAVMFFERAAQIQPGEERWQLMVASCHRRIGDYQLALQMYKDIHHRFPENIECLKFLIRMCTDLGLRELDEYSASLQKAEKMKEIKEQRSKGSSKENSREGIPQALSGGSSSGSGGQTQRTASGSKLPPSGLSGRANKDTIQTTAIDNSPLVGQDSGAYADPLGDLPERPRTSARPKASPIVAGMNKNSSNVNDNIEDSDNDESLLPE